MRHFTWKLELVSNILWIVLNADPMAGISERFAKALCWLENCLSVNNDVCGKLVSVVPIIFVDSPRVTPVSFFVADFLLWSCESDECTFMLLF